MRKQSFDIQPLFARQGSWTRTLQSGHLVTYLSFLIGSENKIRQIWQDFSFSSKSPYATSCALSLRDSFLGGRFIFLLVPRPLWSSPPLVISVHNYIPFWLWYTRCPKSPLLWSPNSPLTLHEVHWTKYSFGCVLTWCHSVLCSQLSCQCTGAPDDSYNCWVIEKCSSLSQSTITRDVVTMHI